MLFNSFEFLFVFLPVVLGGFFALSHARLTRLAVGWLFLASLAFYGYWNVAYLPLLLVSIGVNYGVSRLIEAATLRARAKAYLTLGVVFNLGLLAYYKYAAFFVSSLDGATGLTYAIPQIVLPLGISFFTFTQTAYLVDLYRQETRGRGLLNYGLFVTIFPHLISGPILHHRDVMPQFDRLRFFVFSHRNFAAGSMLFVLGLSKKVLIADKLAPAVDLGYRSLGQLTCLEAWCVACSYALQLYFDFSGYSDMAVGLGKMFNLELPINFNSPYQSRSIAEFWRRWHMTLSAFLRNYLYIPLGGNRHGTFRRYLNLMTTMVLGGLWHGAGWTFVVWGALNGAYLVVNHLWSEHRPPLPKALGVGLTLLATLVAWVFFRAATVHDAGLMLGRMVDVASLRHGLASSWLLGKRGLIAIVVLGIGVLTLKNSNEWVRALPPTRAWGLAFALLAIIALTNISNLSPFLYFQF